MKAQKEQKSDSANHGIIENDEVSYLFQQTALTSYLQSPTTT